MCVSETTAGDDCSHSRSIFGVFTVISAKASVITFPGSSFALGVVGVDEDDELEDSTHETGNVIGVLSIFDSVVVSSKFILDAGRLLIS